MTHTHILYKQILRHMIQIIHIEGNYVIYRFTVKVGDEVQVDDNVMEIETDKTTVGVPTPVSGVIEEIYVQDGDTVKAGQDLFKIKPGAVSGKPKEAAPKEAAAPPPPPPAAAAVPTPPVSEKNCVE